MISIHALLAESDRRERAQSDKPPISIHALLAESDVQERAQSVAFDISIHALLAESDPSGPVSRQGHADISIHALLAESDPEGPARWQTTRYFYPRSPCGERLFELHTPAEFFTHFYPRSPCGERPDPGSSSYADEDFYPRSPCGERRLLELHPGQIQVISIHALLAESDSGCPASCNFVSHFYPRSPCGERHLQDDDRVARPGISIHALLAESDAYVKDAEDKTIEFLSTLSLRRATSGSCWRYARRGLFLSTLSLRRATIQKRLYFVLKRYFYPRSPCGERLKEIER